MTQQEMKFEEEADDLQRVSLRDNMYIIHSGKPPEEHSPLAATDSAPNWPDNLWSTGLLVYDMFHPELSLNPAETEDDKILRFNSMFESGNLEKAYKMGENQYHLLPERDKEIQGDVDKDGHGLCQWFYFAVTNVRAATEYHFFLSGFHKEDNLFSGGAKIFYYSEKRARQEGVGWTRGGTDYAYAVTCRTGAKQKRSTLQFKIEFPYDNDICYICYALPYTYSDLLRSINMWQSIAPGVVSQRVLCQTLCGRDVPVLDITSPNSKTPLAKRSCIFLTGRIHPGESNGSYVLHGLIDFLLSGSPIAHYIIENFIVRIVPMMAVDGVVEGSYRISRNGYDLNRMWKNPSITEQPVVYHTKELIKKTAAERPIVVYIDFHGHSRLHGTFAFGCPNTSTKELKDTEKMLPRLLALVSEEFSWENCVFSFPKTRNDAGRIVVRREIGVVQSFTIETSFGACKAGKNAGMLYDEILWKKVGADCGLAIYHYLNPDMSPLTSYVGNELAFFTPQETLDQDKSSEFSDSISPEIPLTGFEDTLDAEMEVLMNEDGTRRLLVTAPPSQRFQISVDSISTQPPLSLSPSWNRMEFTA